MSLSSASVSGAAAIPSRCCRCIRKQQSYSPSTSVVRRISRDSRRLSNDTSGTSVEHALAGVDGQVGSRSSDTSLPTAATGGPTSRESTKAAAELPQPREQASEEKVSSSSTTYHPTSALRLFHRGVGCPVKDHYAPLRVRYKEAVETRSPTVRG
ncbi:hypothetical protein BJ546DRAFT_122783 [Cryomyces antarcticus]